MTCEDEAVLYNRQAFVHLKARDVETACQCFEQALSALASCGDDRRDQQAMIHNNMGHALAGEKKWEPALEHFGRAALLCEETGNTAGLADQLQNMGSVHRDRQDFDAAVDLYEKARVLFEGNSLPIQTADQHANIGFALYRLKRPGPALDHYRSALAIYRQAGDEAKADLVRKNIAVLTDGFSDE